jgi:murein DD-endopeptidase MepM/ murein hydrolase activator NlpD
VLTAPPPVFDAVTASDLRGAPPTRRKPQEKFMQTPSAGRRPHPIRVRTSAARGSLFAIAAVALALLGCAVLASAEPAVVAAPKGALAAAERSAGGVDVSSGPPPAVAAALVPSLTPLPIPPPDVVEGTIRRGRSLSTSLRAQGVSPQTVHEIDRVMAPYFDFRYSRPGHSYRLLRDPGGVLLGFVYRTSEDNAYYLDRFGDEYRVEQRQADLVPRPTLIAGLVSTTVYSAVRALGESGQLARDFAEVFAWDIDFQRSVKPGDAFQIVYERLVRIAPDGTETYVRPGRILAARYDGAAGRHTAFYFEADEGRGGYYRSDGTSVEGEFLMAPLRHARITSRYSQARRHPILKVTRPHHGIDYAAPSGDPVWAVAAGEVIYRARAGGFGNLVKIRHKNGYVSYYAHLSRFAKGLRVGQKIQQKQVIGVVGQTGLATGPHVCFRVQKDGRYVNPAKLRTGTREAVPDAVRTRFDAAVATRLAELDGRRLIAGVAPSAAAAQRDRFE